MSYDELRTLSFRLKQGIGLQHTFQVLNFPKKSELLQLQADLTGRPVETTNIPISMLNKAMRALVPDLLYIARNAGRSGECPWLYSETAINPQALHLILHAWVQTQFSQVPDSIRGEVLQKLQPQTFCWQPTEVNTSQWTVGENGTANLGNDAQFILLPHLIAARFSQPDVSLQLRSEILRFRRAPLSPGKNGAEVVSWPPLQYEDWYWSVVITFTAQTVPFQDFPVIHADISVRRWASLPITFLPRDKETSVYLLTSVPWLEGLHYSNSFQVAPIGWGRLSSSGLQQGKQKYGWTWGSKLPELLNRLNRQCQFPLPQDIINDPVSALQLNDSTNPTAALIYRNGIAPSHGVNPGFSPAERRQIAEKVAEILASEWEFVETPKRVKYNPVVPKNPFFLTTQAQKKTSLEQFQEQRCYAINQTVGKYLLIEIWCQRTSTSETLIHAVRDILGIPELASFPYRFPNLEFTLNVHVYSLGELGDKLILDPSIKKKADQRRQAIHQRGEDVSAKLPLVSCETVAFIELDNADKFDGDNDPKDALRRGFAYRRRWTQFISTENNGNLPNRALSGFLDLLRQLGVQAEPPKIAIKTYKNSQNKIATTQQTNKSTLPEKLNYVGLWMIQQYGTTSSDGNKKVLPVMIHMASDTTEIKAIACGFKEWLPYREALLALAQEQAIGITRSEQAMTFFQDQLKRHVLPLGDTLLLCHAQNLRSTWSWLTDGKITCDKIAFGHEKLLDISRFSKKLRIVRVRDSLGYETPEWYAPNQNEQGFTKGIFQMGERVFGSTYNTPKQFKLNRNLSKVSPWTTIDRETKQEFTHQPLPNKYYWNPGLIELTVACIQPGDDIWSWAMVAHELRHIALHHDEPLKLPLTLHLAKVMEDYMLLIQNDD